MQGAAPGAEEDTEENNNNWFQILAILVCCLGAVSDGMLCGWICPAIIALTEDQVNYHISLNEATYLAIIPPIGTIISSLAFTKLSDDIGRKSTMLLIVFPCMASWILVALSKSVYLFYLSRFLCGLADACFFSTFPVYVGEISTPAVRGTWGNALTFGLHFGQLLINVMGSYVSVPLTAYVSLVVPLLFGCSFIFMPESPYFYAMKCRHDEAEEALKVLRCKGDVSKEFADLKSDVARQMSESGAWSDLFRIESNRRAFLSGVFLRASQQFGGISVFCSYSQYIFKKAGGILDAKFSSILMVLVLTVVNVVGGFTVDKMGRINSYLISLLSCGFILYLEAIYFFLDLEVGTARVVLFNWFPITGMLIYIVLYAIGLGIVPTLMLSELFSVSVKAKGLGALNIIFSALVFVNMNAFRFLESNVGLYGPFLLFAICCLISSLLTFWLVPETRGKTLEEIQQSLKK